MTSRRSMHNQRFGKNQPRPRYNLRLPSHIIFFWPQNGFHHHKCIPKWFSWHPARCSLVRWKDYLIPMGIWNARIRSFPPLAPREGILASSGPICPPGLSLRHKESFVLYATSGKSLGPVSSWPTKKTMTSRWSVHNQPFGKSQPCPRFGLWLTSLIKTDLLPPGKHKLKSTAMASR